MKYFVVALSFGLSLPILAETMVYGRAHILLEKVSGSKLNIKNNDSFLGLKGVDTLDNGLKVMRQLEFNFDFTNQEKILLVRRSWVGVKGGYGEFRVGLQLSPYGAVDDTVDFLQHNGHRLHVGSQLKNVLAYLNKIGAFGVSASYAANGDSYSDGVADLLINYNTYPLYVGIAYLNHSSDKDGVKLALAVRDSNYAIGLVAEKQAITGDKINTLSGKYIKGGFWLAGQYGKNHSTGESQKNIELGYSLSKKLKSYYEWENINGIQSNRVGLVHDF